MVKIHPTRRQKRKMVRFVEIWPKLGRLEFANCTQRFLWSFFRMIADPHGPARTTKAWRKSWVDWRRAVLRRQQEVVNGQRTALSELDARILQILTHNDDEPLPQFVPQDRYLPALPPPQQVARQYMANGQQEELNRLENNAFPAEIHISRYSGEVSILQTCEEGTIVTIKRL